MPHGWFSRLLGRNDPFPPVLPDRALFVIGDVHGCADLLERALNRAGANEQVICVGDYVDRGEHSADVIDLLRGLPDVICLKGNHEDMLLDFLDDPDAGGARWLRHGGLQTLASYDLPGASETARGEDIVAIRDRLAESMGADTIAWLKGLPTMYRSGNIAVTHAGADPTSPMDQQQETVLMWGHPRFLGTPRSDGIWIVHGHTIVDAPTIRQGRIAIDTGAYATGRLTAARLSDAEVAFLNV